MLESNVEITLLQVNWDQERLIIIFFSHRSYTRRMPYQTNLLKFNLFINIYHFGCNRKLIVLKRRVLVLICGMPNSFANNSDNKNHNKKPAKMFQRHCFFMKIVWLYFHCATLEFKQSENLKTFFSSNCSRALCALETSDLLFFSFKRRTS